MQEHQSAATYITTLPDQIALGAHMKTSTSAGTWFRVNVETMCKSSSLHFQLPVWAEHIFLLRTILVPDFVEPQSRQRRRIWLLPLCKYPNPPPVFFTALSKISRGHTPMMHRDLVTQVFERGHDPASTQPMRQLQSSAASMLWFHLNCHSFSLFVFTFASWAVLVIGVGSFLNMKSRAKLGS